MSSDKPDAPGRRKFLKDLAAAGGAAALAATAGVDAAEAGSGDAASARPEPRGYRLTEHVDAYYRTLRA